LKVEKETQQHYLDCLPSLLHNKKRLPIVGDHGVNIMPLYKYISYKGVTYMRSRFFIIALLLISFLGIAGCATTGGPGLRSDVAFPYMETGNEWNKRYGDEPYVFLLSDDIMEVKEDFSYTEDAHLVIKIQKEEGKKIGEFPLPYDSSREKIEGIQAYVLTPDGRKLKYSAIQENSFQQGFAVYSDYKVKTITFPNVLIGSMIDIRFRLHHLIPKMEGEFFETTVPGKIFTHGPDRSPEYAAYYQIQQHIH